MSRCEVAVIIPSLGRDSLERAVRSVARQTCAPIEILIVLNGMTPMSREREEQIRRESGSVAVRFENLPPLSGPSIARNVGAWNASAKYLAFLDDDDEFEASYIEVMSDRILSSAPDFLYATRMWTSEDGSVRQAQRLTDVPAEDWFERLYRRENPGFGGTNLVARREAFFEVGGFPTYFASGEDRALAMAILSTGRLPAFVEQAVVVCHVPSGFRVSGSFDKWLVHAWLLRSYWSEVTWRSRLRALWRLIRTIPRSRSRDPSTP